MERTFVEKLNSMPSANEVAGKRRVDDWNKTIEGLHYAVNSACIENRDQRVLNGYLIHKYDAEYSQSSYGFADSLAKDNSGMIWMHSRVGDKRSASVVSDRYHQNRQGCEPISKDSSVCNKAIPALYNALINDGFKNIKLETVACYEEYDVVKSKGLISPKLYTVRQMTNELLGYVIKVSLNW